MAHEDIIALLARAEEKYHLKIFENICERSVRELPLRDRLKVVGSAVMERTDYEGFVLGRRLVAASEEVNGRC